MENKIVPPAVHHESMDNRSEWITPAIVDYDIEETTRALVAGNPHFDGVTAYS